MRRVDGAFVRHLMRRARSRVAYETRFKAVGKGSWIGRPLLLSNVGEATVGSRTFVREGARIEVVKRPGSGSGVLSIGDDVGIEQDVHIVVAQQVLIENEVTLAPRVVVLDCAHPEGREGDGPRHASLSPESAPVVIKHRAFLGANVVVLPGVTVGRNSIVGANSVVTADVPDNCVAVGAPARVVRKLPTD